MFLVLGFGNPLREDDGVAWRVCEELRRTHPELRVIVVPQLLPELATELSRCDGVVFVDARVGAAPGLVHRQALRSAAGLDAIGHAIDPALLIAITAQLCGHEPRAALVTVTVGRLGFGESLSPEVEAAVPGAAREVIQQLTDWNRAA
jgi:hydrogenase maturation protease